MDGNSRLRMLSPLEIINARSTFQQQIVPKSWERQATAADVYSGANAFVHGERTTPLLVGSGFNDTLYSGKATIASIVRAATDNRMRAQELAALLGPDIASQTAAAYVGRPNALGHARLISAALEEISAQVDNLASARVGLRQMERGVYGRGVVLAMQNVLDLLAQPATRQLDKAQLDALAAQATAILQQNQGVLSRVLPAQASTLRGIVGRFRSLVNLSLVSRNPAVTGFIPGTAIDPDLLAELKQEEEDAQGGVPSVGRTQGEDTVKKMEKEDDEEDDEDEEGAADAAQVPSSSKAGAPVPSSSGQTASDNSVAALMQSLAGRTQVISAIQSAVPNMDDQAATLVAQAYASSSSPLDKFQDKLATHYRDLVESISSGILPGNGYAVEDQARDLILEDAQSKTAEMSVDSTGNTPAEPRSATERGNTGLDSVSAPVPVDADTVAASEQQAKETARNNQAGRLEKHGVTSQTVSAFGVLPVGNPVPTTSTLQSNLLADGLGARPSGAASAGVRTPQAPLNQASADSLTFLQRPSTDPQQVARNAQRQALVTAAHLNQSGVAPGFAQTSSRLPAQGTNDLAVQEGRRTNIIGARRLLTDAATNLYSMLTARTDIDTERTLEERPTEELERQQEQDRPAIASQGIASAIAQPERKASTLRQRKSSAASSAPQISNVPEQLTLDNVRDVYKTWLRNHNFRNSDSRKAQFAASHPEIMQNGDIREKLYGMGRKRMMGAGAFDGTPMYIPPGYNRATETARNRARMPATVYGSQPYADESRGPLPFQGLIGRKPGLVEHYNPPDAQYERQVEERKLTGIPILDTRLPSEVMRERNAAERADDVNHVFEYANREWVAGRPDRKLYTPARMTGLGKRKRDISQKKQNQIRSLMTQLQKTV